MASTTASSPRLAYPPAHRSDVSYELHGERICDPYRWLEDPDSPETRAWVSAQQATTGAYFSGGGVAPLRASVRARLEQLQSYERVGCPFTRGGRTFAFKNTGLQNQDVMWQLAGPDGGPGGLFDGATAFLDLNAAYPAGTTSLGSNAFSEDGALFAYGLSTGGSDWQTLRVRDVATGADLPDDVIPNTKFTSIAWLVCGPLGVCGGRRNWEPRRLLTQAQLLSPPRAVNGGPNNNGCT